MSDERDKEFGDLIESAKAGGESQIFALRAFVASVGENAPTEALIEVAEFLRDMRKRDVKKHIERN